MSSEKAPEFRGGIWPYIEIARIDHWFKNAFMLLGVLLAFFYQESLFELRSLGILAWALATTCLVASSNYVLNEYLDAPMDRLHPKKRFRPAARGAVNGPIALLEWGLLGLIGILMGFALNAPFGASALLLWIMGCLYNIPPVRTKEVPFLDVLSESLNNPIRLLLGWFALVPDQLPPLSLALSYWMVGAFFMAAKRFAEYREIDDPVVAAKYRRSFAFYDEARLLASMSFYLAAGSLFGGIFIVRYKLELILVVPFVAGFFAWYTSLSMRPDSPVQNPEKLHREKAFFAYALFCTALFIVLMYVRIPALYGMFNVEARGLPNLWTVRR